MADTVIRHRRSSRLAWVGVAAAVVLALSGGAAAVLRGNEPARATGCTGEKLVLNIAAAPEHAPVLQRLADSWSATKPAVDHKCVGAAVRPIPANQVAATVGPGWDEQRDGTRPDVWAPESSAWLLVAAGRPEAAGMLPTATSPSLASSPVVLAMQRPMAQALGWPDRPVGWSDLAGAFAGGQGWVKFGHPEWGTPRLGMVDPTRSTPGLFSALTFLDPDNDGSMNNEELLGGLSLAQLATVAADDTAAMLRPFVDAGAQRSAPTTLASAFPILERDLADYLGSKPNVDLAPVYPKEGTTFADYPYAVLKAPWVDQPRQRAAADFLTYLRSGAGPRAFSAAGYRDADRALPDTPMYPASRGFQRTIQVPVRTPTASGLGQLLGMWNVLQRSNNMLLALDTSGSMKEPVPGTDLSRLQLVQRAAIQGVSLLNNQTSIGLWEFSSRLTPSSDFRELVPLGRAGEAIGEVNRRQAMAGAIQGLQPNKDTGLYDTVLAGYQRMLAAWQPNSQNVFVVMTDGKNEDDDGIGLQQLLDQLRQVARADRPLPIIALAVGPEADAAALQQICAVTGGRTFIARDESTAIQQIVLAFAGRIS